MWHSWLQVPPSRKPRYWWSQIQREPSAALPFAHLFPTPPPGLGPAPGPSLRLVQDLGREVALEREACGAREQNRVLAKTTRP